MYSCNALCRVWPKRLCHPAIGHWHSLGLLPRCTVKRTTRILIGSEYQHAMLNRCLYRLARYPFCKVVFSLLSFYTLIDIKNLHTKGTLPALRFRLSRPCYGSCVDSLPGHQLRLSEHQSFVDYSVRRNLPFVSSIISTGQFIAVSTRPIHSIHTLCVPPVRLVPLSSPLLPPRFQPALQYQRYLQ